MYPQIIMYFKPFKCRVKPRAREFTKIRTYGMRAKRKPNLAPNFSNAFTCELLCGEKIGCNLQSEEEGGPLQFFVKPFTTHSPMG
jgi:hypothetical protein